MKNQITDPFLRSYLIAAFWTSDFAEGAGDYETNGNWPELMRELAPEDEFQTVQECTAFEELNAADLSLAYADPDYDSDKAGHDFWLSRNGHGAGYFDRFSTSICPDYERLQSAAVISRDFSARDALTEYCQCPYHACQRLQRAARACGARDLYRGDDGKLYFS